ncbi:MAG TPA: hypothetical protein VND96_17560 [Candidatus Micrarchaeaceae archaeon]|nr:hypothetical protein [Candidatus Micrarchaeaceae archaeon]
MLLGLVYSCLRLLLDGADVHLRRQDPQAELLLLRHELRGTGLFVPGSIRDTVMVEI